MKKYFYDIHCHAMNMSHPNFLAFTKRFETGLYKGADKFLKKNRFKTFFGVNFLMFYFMFFKKFNSENLSALLKKVGLGDYPDRAKNLIALMENDTGNFFILMEDCLVNHIMKNGKIMVGHTSYDKVLLTPLIMDFGSTKSAYSNIHYNKKPVSKPIGEQIIDLFNGIHNYNCKSSYKIFEIYPFIGINTKNYSMEQLCEMLKTSFNNFDGTYKTLSSAAKEVDSHNSESHTYAGVKVYPPLGFDPWPDETKELEKVMFLYEFCQSRHIPITCHCSDEGFFVVDDEDLERFTSPSSWGKVLRNYPMLKLNLAHFGKQENSNRWEKGVIELIKAYDNVYTDISHRGFDDAFYKSLKNTIRSFDDKALVQKMKKRILFGSDFMINLFKIDSYCKYYDVFISTKHFTTHEKEGFCCSNPQSFLFGKTHT